MIDEGDAWKAVSNRDRAWDGKLFYGVRTTGVFCRPSCPSRRPKRGNVVFFESAEQAEGAGFRPCRRCEPRSPAGTTTERRLRTAVKYIEDHVDERLTLERLGKAVGLSPHYLQRLFKERIGLSPRELQNALRLEAMRNQLREGKAVGRAVWSAGYGSVRGAYESAANGLGMTPGDYRRGGSDLTIQFSIHETRFGHVGVGSTRRGVCAVMLGDSPDHVIRQIEAEFPSANLVQGDPADSAWARAVIESLEGRHPGLVVPLDLQGTNFQMRVWQTLQRIPVGEVRSYTEVAERIGSPRSARAVARACAGNRAAVVVPCHRVVRADGSPGGYRWGEARKRALLDHERELADAARNDPVDRERGNT